MSRALTAVSTADLLALRKLVATGAWSSPWSKAAAAAGFALAADALAGFDDVDAVGLVAVVDAVVGERGEARRPAELVWTGPEPHGAKARDTAVVVEQMFAEARREVFVASLSFNSPPKAPPLFAPLHRVMVEHGVTATVVYDVGDFAGAEKIERAEATKAARFFARHWPFGGPLPALYYDPRGVDDVRMSMHAKVVVVDRRFVLVGSANLTDRGVTRNIELGVKLDDEALATRLVEHWSAAIASKIVVSAA